MPIRTEAEGQWSWIPRWHQARAVLEQSLDHFLTEDSLTISASIAYHALLSLFPLLLLLLGLSGIFIRRYELAGHLAVALESYLPMKPDFILLNLEGISRAYGRVGLVSILLLLWGSSGVFLPLEKALNRAWDVPQERTWVRRHLLAFEMAVITGILILLSSSLVGLNIYIHPWVRRWSAYSFTSLVEFIYHAFIISATFSLTLGMFVVLFARLPNRRLEIRQVLPGALLTAILWEGALSLFSLLLPVFNYRHIYGSIGVVVALMTWAYVSSAVTLFGAQVSRVLYRTLKAPTASQASPSEVSVASAERVS
jgi:membrane protein